MRRLHSGWLIAAGLLAVSLLWPWWGWQGLRTGAPAFALGALTC